jgi:hypothetical protein
MYNKRWFKVLAAVVLLASVAFAASPSGAAASFLASNSSNCEAALRQGVGNVMPSQLSDREMCFLVRQIQAGPSYMVAGAQAAGTARLAAPVLPGPEAGWQDAGAARFAALLPAAGWQDAGAARPSAALAAPGYYFRFPTHIEGHGQ